MKKQKRNVQRRAYLRGYMAGIRGKSRDEAPVQLRADWLGGWRDGRADFWDGRTGVSGIQTNPMLG